MQRLKLHKRPYDVSVEKKAVEKKKPAKICFKKNCKSGLLNEYVIVRVHVELCAEHLVTDKYIVNTTNVTQISSFLNMRPTNRTVVHSDRKVSESNCGWDENGSTGVRGGRVEKIEQNKTSSHDLSVEISPQIQQIHKQIITAVENAVQERNEQRNNKNMGNLGQGRHYSKTKRPTKRLIKSAQRENAVTVTERVCWIEAGVCELFLLFC